METTGYSIIAGAVLLEVMAQLAFKRGALGVAGGEADHDAIAYFRWLAASPWMHLGIALYGVELLLWIAALVLLPLSVAFPLIGISYCGTAIGGHFWLGEALSRRAVAGIVLVAAGAALVTG